MRIKITYCTAWNYLPQAASLAADLKRRFAVDSELIKGGGGELEVVVDGRKVFSKLETGRFPEDAEIVAAIEKIAGRR